MTSRRWLACATLGVIGACECNPATPPPADAGTPVADAGPDAGPDAGAPDAGPTIVTGSIIETFCDGGALDPDASTAETRSGCGLVAPTFAFDPSDCSGGAFSANDAGSVVELDAGVYQVLSLFLDARVILHSTGDLDFRVCGDVTLGDYAQLQSDGRLRITTWGNLALGDRASLEGSNETFVAVADAGARYSGGGTIFGAFNTAANPDAGLGAVTVLVNGDVNLSGQSNNCDIFGEPLTGHYGAPVRIEVAGAMTSAGCAFFTDDGASFSESLGPLSLKVGKDLTLEKRSNIFLSGGAPLAPLRALDVTVGGSLVIDGTAAGGSSGIFAEGYPTRNRVRVRGDLTMKGNTYLGADSDETDGGPSQLNDILALGRFTCDGDGVISSGDPQNGGGGRSAGQPAGALVVRAAAIDLTNCLVYAGGAGPGGAAGGISLLAQDGGIAIRGGDAGVYGQTGYCAPGNDLSLATTGDITTPAGAKLTSFNNFHAALGVRAGDSVGSDLNGCNPERGGSVHLVAGGDIDAGPVAGGGNPDGSVDFHAHAAVDAGFEAIVLTETFTAESVVYDLGAASLVTAVHAVHHTDAGEPQVGPVEVATSDSPSGPWTFTTDLGALGKHRYLKWRTTVDRLFFTSASLDRLEIDWQR